MIEWREFLERNEPKASAPVPSWAHLLVGLVGREHERLHEQVLSLSALVGELHQKVDEALRVNEKPVRAKPLKDALTPNEVRKIVGGDEGGASASS